jgi:signal transduction histidine kinase
MSGLAERLWNALPRPLDPVRSIKLKLGILLVASGGVAFNQMSADLAAADRQRRELIANVSHELRTPISALRAVLENLVDGVTSPDPHHPPYRTGAERATVRPGDGSA